MKPGNIVLAALPQSDGKLKQRPALLLKFIPPYNDLLVCGISSKLHQEVIGFDQTLKPNDSDFASSKLVQSSVIRLGYLVVLPKAIVSGSIGHISDKRLQHLKQSLVDFLLSN